MADITQIHEGSKAERDEFVVNRIQLTQGGNVDCVPAKRYIAFEGTAIGNHAADKTGEERIGDGHFIQPVTEGGKQVKVVGWLSVREVMRPMRKVNHGSLPFGLFDQGRSLFRQFQFFFEATHHVVGFEKVDGIDISALEVSADANDVANVAFLGEVEADVFSWKGAVVTDDLFDLDAIAHIKKWSGVNFDFVAEFHGVKRDG